MRRLAVVHSGRLDPVENMAIDEAAFAAAGSPMLRIYGWRPAGLSLGYFQRFAEFDGEPGDHVLVRRATGGGAILHDDEITFALTCEAELLPSDLGASYDLVHGAIADVLSNFGVPTERHGRGAVSCRPEDKWCFAKPTCHDLTTPSGKIVGSAQRRTANPTPRVLHHGSIVMRRPRAPENCGAVEEFVAPDSIREDLERALAQAIARSLDLEPVSDAPQLDVATARQTVHARLRAR